MSLLINKKKWIWYVVPTVIVVSLIVFTIEIHNNEENSINEAFLENQIEIQQTVTAAIARNISSEIQLMLSELRILSNSDALQNDLGTAESNMIIQETFTKMNSISPTAQILAVDENFEVVSQVSRHHAPLVGAKLSELELFLNEKPDFVEPIVSTYKDDLFQIPQVVIIHPIIDEETKILKGTIVVTLPSDKFFARHGNIYDLGTQFIVVLSEEHRYLVGPTDVLIGEDFFGDKSQEHFNYNQIQKTFYEKVVSGHSAFALYDYGQGERLNTGHSITINGQNVLFLFVITPTDTIYGEVNQIISFDKIQTSLLIITITIILGILLFKRTKIFEQEKLATIGQLSSNIAHDIRNPLGAIRSASIIIEKENKGQNDVVSRELDRLKISTKRISHQVEEVLNYVKTTPLQLKNNSILKTINEAINSIDVPEDTSIIILQKKDVQFAYDREKILIVFVNIILNAVQSIGEAKGHIKIDLEEYKSEVIIHFENSGPPIPENDLSRLFEPLFTTRLKGTGLGLSSCKNIITQHRGTISVTQEPVRFSVSIPKDLE